MLRNFFVIAWRNVRKNKAYATINVLGLSLGIACSLLIFTFVHYNLSFDDFHPGKDRAYRLVTVWHDQFADSSQGTPSPLGRVFRKDLDVAEKLGRVIDFSGLVTIRDKGVTKKFDERIAYAEPEFFDIFNFPLIRGDQSTALHAPGQVLITEKIAKKYFGDAGAAMGRTIRVFNQTDFQVVGVLRDLPVNTDRRQEIYLSFSSLGDHNRRLAGDSVWGSVYSQFMTFVRLKPAVTVPQVNKDLAILSKKYQEGRDAQTVVFRLQPLADIHFNPAFDGSVDKKYLWALGCIGLFILITACVNFINLATAQALNRSTEVGIRKVLGSLARQLFWQFIIETALIAVFAVVLGYIAAASLLPALNTLFKTQISLHFLTDPSAFGFAIVLLLVMIFLSGSYPGLVLSRFQPVVALKSRIAQSQVGGFSLRRILVVSQFAISQMLIIGAIVLATQLHFVQNADIGFNKEAIVTLPVPKHDAAKINTLRSRFLAIGGVDRVSFCADPPASEGSSSTNIRFANRSEDEHWEVSTKPADTGYLSTFQLRLVAGRNFFAADTAREYLVNETMIRKLNLHSPSEAIGKQMSIHKQPGLIVGVVRDFNNFSLHTDISPICIFPGTAEYSTCAIKLQPAHFRASLAAIENIWNETFPDYLYSYAFLDESIAKFYATDSSLLQMIEGFAAIAVFVGCLGLYGLTSFMAVRKTREIGVRKVLGAGIASILWLFGREFTRLVVLAFVIAAPLAGWVMHNYLQDFKYRITIGPGIFALSIAATALIVLLTVSYQSVRSALANPIKSLRTE